MRPPRAPAGRVPGLLQLPHPRSGDATQFASATDGDAAAMDIWLRDLLAFLEEDRQLVESAQRGYRGGFVPGPPHALERRILHWQAIYKKALPQVMAT